MAELRKPWNDGGSLTATYEGSGDGSAIFSSDVYEGIDREQSVIFRDADKVIAIERVVRQEGIRQPIGLSGGGIFRLANGGRFGVLKPTPYTRVEYIQSTSSQWIDTYYIPNNTTQVEMQISGVTKESFKLSAGGTWFIGGRQGYLNKAYGYYYNPQQNKFYFAFGNLMPSTLYTTLYNSIKTIKMGGDGFYVDGIKIISVTNNNFTSPVSLVLFALNNNGSVISQTGYNMHYCKIWDNNILVRDFIPVLDNNNIACMYDKISGKFFYNQGAEDFIVGNVIE